MHRNLAYGFYLTPDKSAVDRNLQETRRDLEEARVAVKKASARSDELLKTDMDLLARSSGQIADVRDRSKRKEKNRSHRFRFDRTMLERHLQQAEQHIAIGQEYVSRQRERVVQLERNGHETYNAIRLLALFEELQAMHIAHRDRLARQLTGDVR